MAAAIARAAGRRVPVVLSTRTGSGRVSLGNAQPGPFSRLPGADEAPYVLSAEDMPPLKARILLMLALTRTRDPHDMQRMFGEY
jgi:L-asparaginase